MRGIVAVLFLAAFGGYLSNIIKIILDLGDNPVTSMFIARVVGVFAVPLGVVLGYF